MQTIFFGSDYNGTGQVAELKKKLATYGKVVDVVEEDPTLDSYIKISLDIAKRAVKEGGVGVMLCGSGTGSSIMANKVSRYLPRASNGGLCQNHKQRQCDLPGELGTVFGKQYRDS